MEAVGVVLVVIVLVALVCVGLYYAHKAEKERTEALRTIARENGWTFNSVQDSAHASIYKAFGVFSRGHSRRALNTIEGGVTINGHPHHLKMGDYEFKETTRNGKQSQTTNYRFSYLCLHLPYMDIPDLFIRREHFFDKIGAALGFDDIDFESAEFSRTFHVSASDKRFAYDVISPAMMEFLLASPKVGVEMRTGIICVQAGFVRWKPPEFLSNLAWVYQFIDRWPDHVIHGLHERNR